ncbi:short transient receptor potential channel 4-like [Anoplophora glabripennis]|uniref:short transient receptor potential channel 4-like n=1 Tax=Anoplophora glabripennis TaxID=217634 RepID=UPI000A13FC65|nr:short transient receptor potential channel 4-like [Anoplophora glabripennis]
MAENENRETPNPPPPPPPPIPSKPSPNWQGNQNLRPNRSPYRRLSEEADVLVPRPSILLPQLQDKEKKFFELVASGDVISVKEFLETNRDININCTNFQGVTALLIAVQSHADPMVEFLLTQQGIDIGDCVLHAVKDNQPIILIQILDKLNETAPSLEFVGATHSSDFPDYVTPLILAAQCGHYEIIKMLIERGHTISKPHPPTCRCSDCTVQLEHDDLLHAESLKLNLYRAVCNPAYICYSTHDPILAAFHLSEELKQCSFLVPEFRLAYAELAAEVSNFAVDLIACCRSTNEMELILSQSAGMKSAKLFVFPRLVLAMDTKQKTFVAHPNTQQIVEAAWCGDWHDYKIKPFTFKLLYPFLRIIVLPVITLMNLITPNHSLVKHWSTPRNKMISHIAAYIIFLLLIFFESNLDKTGQKRKPPNSGLEPVIMVFVAGNVWSVIRMLILQGPSRYLKKLWNWHDIISNFLFVLTFLFWLASYFDAVHNDQVDLERKYWHQLDPLLIAEGCFAIATIMAFFRLIFFCRLNYYMGPLQISLGKMCADLAKYIIVFVIVILSFSAGLCRFYQPYDGMIQVDSDIKTQQVSSFINFSTTLKTFFWAIFCMSPLESADVVIENLPGDTPTSTIINTHEFTEAVGYIAFALFEVLIVVMILNMLIATMSATFQRVIDNLDVEWTFGKTDFYIEYMLQSTTPSPLNLIPTPGGISSFMELLQGPKVAGKQSPPQACCEKTTTTSNNAPDKKMSELEYPALMTMLVQRYFREKDTVVAAASEMDILRQEIHELKVLLSNIIEEK